MTTQQLDTEATDLYAKFFAARDSESGWKKEKDRLKAEIEERYGAQHLAEDNTALVDSDGKLVAKVKHVGTRRFNSKRLQAERPEIYADYQDSDTQVRIEAPKP